MPKESYRSDLRIERYENWKKQTGFRFLEDREERRKKKEKGEKKKNGRRAATGAGHASTIGWSNAAPAIRRHVSPASRAESQREPNRTDRTGPGRPTATTRKRARVQPATGAFPRAWNDQFGPVVFCLPDFCPGSSSNTVFT